MDKREKIPQSARLLAGSKAGTQGSLTNAISFSLRRACSHRPDATLFLLNYLIAVFASALYKTTQARSHRWIS